MSASFRAGAVINCLRMDGSTFRMARHRSSKLGSAFCGHHRYSVDDVRRLAIMLDLERAGRSRDQAYDIAFGRQVADLLASDNPIIVIHVVTDLTGDLETVEIAFGPDFVPPLSAISHICINATFGIESALRRIGGAP